MKISIKISIEAPQIAEEQKKFRDRNPGLNVTTVDMYNKGLQRKAAEIAEDVRADIQDVVDRDGSADSSVDERPDDNFISTVDFSTVDGIRGYLKVKVSGVLGGFAVGSVLAMQLLELLNGAITDMIRDPLSEHRRRHIEEILKATVEADPKVNVDKERAKLEGCLALDVLCIRAGALDFLSEMHKMKAESRDGQSSPGSFFDRLVEGLFR